MQSDVDHLKRDKSKNKDKKDKTGKKDKKRKREDEVANGAAHPESNGSSTANGNSKKAKVADALISAKMLPLPDFRCDPQSPEVVKFHQDNNITVEGKDCGFRPVQDFSELNFDDDLMSVTRKFSKPTPIQSQCWPIILADRDIIGIAETGSGKTLAFSLPILYHIKHGQRSKSALMLVLAPTRELAKQTADVCEVAGADSKIKTICIYGGVDKGAQISVLRSGVDIIVATPGRLLDLQNDGVLDLSKVGFLVLDEADRMLDMGFEKDIRATIKLLKSKRQTLMFSATWPEAIQKLAHDFLNNPVKVTIGSHELTANQNVTQVVEVIEPFDKDKRLQALLKQYHASKTNRVLIFVLYKKEAIRLEPFLRSKGFAVDGIHADKNQYERTKALEGFKSGTKPLLVATDVAARGLDVPNVEYVINYTFPLTIEDYIHRIGRTGRAGKKGTAHTFFTKFDKAHSGELINVLKDANQKVPSELMQFGTAVKPKKKPEPKLAGPIDINATSTGHLTFGDDDDE